MPRQPARDSAARVIAPVSVSLSASEATGVAAPATRSERLPGLDALRAIAAMSVVLMHMTSIYQSPRLFGPAYLAVDFFFLLSGFVMARTYEARMRSGKIAAAGFLGARYLRLWPTMVVGAVLSFPFFWRDSETLAFVGKVAVLNFFLWPSFAAIETFPLNVPAWSIFFELVANFIHGLVLHRLGNRALAALVAVFLVLLAASAWHFGHLDIGSRQVNFFGGLVRVGFSYGLGILLWRLHGDRAPIRIPPLLTLLAMPALFIGIAASGREGWLFDVAFVALVCPLLLWGGLAIRQGRLDALAFAAGALSFPLYAVHFPILLGTEAFDLPGWTGTMLALVAAGLVARYISSRALTFGKPAHQNV